MNDLQLLVAHATKVALIALLAGIAWRGRVRLCWSFALYVLAALLGNVLVSVWPSTFLLPSVWVLKQGVYDALKVAIALELAFRVFSALPGAARTARAVILVLLASSTVALGLLAPGSSYHTVWNWQPRVTTAALWLLTATALMAVWYQVPMHEWQRAIMLGLAPYLLVFVALLDLLRRRGWSLLEPVTTAEAFVYLGLVLFWTGAAWWGDAPQLAPTPAEAS
ncbi:MAG TPA: hypothetical protein VMT70_12235 [Vicinamibacteria bacterium]|nr:hypothetical protein [Vicinamibacteria bacterium]